MINGKIITTIPVVKQQATLYFLEKGTNQFELSLADDNGVLRTLYSGAGGASTTVPTLSQVLSAGNSLDGKELQGNFRVTTEDVTLAGNKTTEFTTRDNNLEFYSTELTHRENLEFRASLSDLHYNSFVENADTFGLHLDSDNYSINIPDKNSGIFGANVNLKFDSYHGLHSSKVFSVSEDNQFIQKKYLDDRLAGLSTGGGGTGTASPQTLSQVLTAGNDLDGKEIVGDLVVKYGDTTTDNYTLSAKKESLRYEGYKQNGETYDLHVSKDGLIYSSNVEVNGNHMDASFRADSKGIDFNTDASGHVVGAGFKANTEGVLYQAWGSDSNGLTLALNNAEFKVELNQTGGNADTLSLGINAGLSSSKYYEPTKDEQYVQKKYVDSLLEGGKIDVTVDRMYLTYAGKLAVDITVNGLPSNKVADTGLFDHSTFRMEVANGASSIRAFFTFGPTGNATIEKTYLYYETGTVKAHIEAVLPSAAVDSWGVPNPGKDIFNKTRGFFLYIPEAGMPFNKGVRSRMTHYGEVYDKRQSGVVNFKLQDGKQSTLIPSTEEYKFFAFDADTFKAEDPVDSTYSYLINNGIPIGSQDVQSGYILSDNRIMPNPTPNQVTEWDLTFKVSGPGSTSLTGSFEHFAVVYDAKNNIVDQVPLSAAIDAAGELIYVRAKLTTINRFKNIVGEDRGFKFGIKLTSNYDSVGTEYQLINIKRTSKSLD